MLRYVLIDYMHLAHRCIKSTPLHATMNIDNQVQVIDTTIAAYTIKNIFNYSGRGQYFTAVCFEGGANRRKQYFANQDGGLGVKKGTGYKGNRDTHRGAFYQGIKLAIDLMYNGKVSMYRIEGLEADDCIASLVQKIKLVDKITPIDIVTNDSDLLPFVDDQVSVYMRGSRQFAEENCPELHLYYQVTPNTWEEYLSYTSAHKGYTIPYNSMLLFKMIRGDKSDTVAGACSGFGKVRYSDLMTQMTFDDVDFPNIFRYGIDFDGVMRPVLENYFTEEEVNKMKFIYEGIRPMYANLDVPKQIEPGYLQKALSPAQIHILK